MLAFLSFIVAAVGLLFGFRQNYRARLRQFEEKYVERYWTIVDDLSLAAHQKSTLPPCPGDELAIRKYIALCEDELELRGNGYISDTTYYQWADGMVQQFRQFMFKSVWETVDAQEQKERSPAYDHLRVLLNGMKSEQTCVPRDLHEVDPLKQNVVIRTLTGLHGFKDFGGI